MVDQKFIVLGNSASINNGIYMLESKGNKNLVLDVKDHSKTSGTKFSLAYKENTDYQFFEITHVGNGYYTLKNVASGKYVEVTGAAAVNSTFLQQNDKNNGSSQKWQIISAEDGYYWFVPECAKKFCLNLQNNGKTENSYAQIYSPTFSEGQQIKLIKGEMKEIFTDVKSYNWFYDYVGYVYKNNLMSGNAYEGLFNPNTAVTRGQVITTIYRLAGSPKVKDYKACSVFSDVEKDKYYTDAVCWAYNEGITTGNPDTGKFNTTASITRQQLATFFFRYAELAGYEINKRADLSSMLNADQVKNYAKEAMEWAVAADLISGSETTDASGKVTYDLKPNGTATRAQLAAILYRFCYYNDL